MKKMLIICITPFVLATLFVGGIMSISHTISYPFNTTKGDKKYLENVAFEADVWIQNVEGSLDRNLHVRLQHQQGATSHQFEYLKSYNEIDNANYEMIASSHVIQRQEVVYANGYEDPDRMECKEVEEKVEEIPITYDLIFAKGNRQFYIENGGEIKSDLRYKSSDHVQFYKKSTTCPVAYNSDIEVEYIYDYKDTEETIVDNVSGTSFINVDASKNDKFYFMPSTNEAMVGQNKVYKMDIEKDPKDEFTYQATTSDFIQLPTDRYYYAIYQNDGNLIILAYTNDRYIFMNYDENGNFISEVAIQRKDKELMGHVLIDKNYMFLEMSESVEIYDTKTQTIVETLEKTDAMKENYSLDMMYIDHVLYVLMDRSIEESDIQDTELISSRRKNALGVQVISKDGLLYEGIQNIYDSKKVKRNQLQYITVDNATFVRDDI